MKQFGLILCMIFLLISGCEKYEKPKYTKLTDAIKNGDAKDVRQLIDRGANVNEPDEQGYPPIELAAGKGDIEILQLLITKGANINSFKEMLPICRAIENGHVEAVKLLISKGADVNKTCDKIGYYGYPIKRALANNDPVMFKLLIESGAIPNRKILEDFYRFGSIENPELLAMVKKILTDPVSCSDKELYDKIAKILYPAKEEPILNRDQESFVYALCQNNIKDADWYVDYGIIKPEEAIKIAKALGKNYVLKQRTEKGKRYEYASKTLDSMNIEICLPTIYNAAYHYSEDPDSYCGKIVANALKRDKRAIKMLEDQESDWYKNCENFNFSGSEK